jgi:hypothetical protein
MVKVISLFLVGMVILALFGRLRMPRGKRKSPRRLSVERCARCGKPLIGKGPCECGKKA